MGIKFHNFKITIFLSKYTFYNDENVELTGGAPRVRKGLKPYDTLFYIRNPFITTRLFPE